ncbi:MAG: luciferase family protein [Anaerolineales bacterium]
MTQPTIPHRSGPRPRTTAWAPHIQQDQQGSPEMLAALAARVYALPDVEDRPTILSAEGARAIWLRDRVKAGPSNAFLGGYGMTPTREIGHFHPWDGSLHIALPPAVAQEAVAAGWAEVHPVAQAGMAPTNIVMLYGPRDESEVNVLFELILAAYRYAGGRDPVRVAA